MNARASANFGVLANYVDNTAIAGSVNFNDTLLGTATSYWQDDFLLNAGGLENTSGTLIVKFTIEGTLSASQPQIDPNNSQTNARANYVLSNVGVGTLAAAGERQNADGTRTAHWIWVIPQRPANGVCSLHVWDSLHVEASGKHQRFRLHAIWRSRSS
ncbi:MAG TPA: hypothetical protein VF614_11720 [Chthoniobacteraceae bacterium]